MSEVLELQDLAAEVLEPDEEGGSLHSILSYYYCP